MDQGARLKRVVAALVPHQSLGRAQQLTVDGPDQTILGVGTSRADFAEHGGQFTPLFGAHPSSPAVEESTQFVLRNFHLGDCPEFSHTDETNGSVKLESA